MDIRKVKSTRQRGIKKQNAASRALSFLELGLDRKIVYPKHMGQNLAVGFLLSRKF